MDAKTARIRALNDQLRTESERWHRRHLPPAWPRSDRAVERIVKTIMVYDDFCQADDPHQEHDFGAFDAEDHRILFKIDYFDKSLTFHSPDAADPSVTERVITIMLAEEY